MGFFLPKSFSNCNSIFSGILNLNILEKKKLKEINAENALAYTSKEIEEILDL